MCKEYKMIESVALHGLGFERKRCLSNREFQFGWTQNNKEISLKTSPTIKVIYWRLIWLSCSGTSSTVFVQLHLGQGRIVFEDACVINQWQVPLDILAQGTLNIEPSEQIQSRNVTFINQCDFRNRPLASCSL